MSLQEDLVELLDTGVKVVKHKLEKCNKSSFSKFVTDLLVATFGKDVLAESSLTGTVSNISKNKGGTAKKQLDTTILNAIKRKLQI